MAKNNEGEKSFSQRICPMIQNASSSESPSKVFQDMVESIVLALRNQSEPDALRPAREKRWEEIRDYHGQDVIDVYANVLAELVLEAGKRDGDLLGEIYMNLGYKGRSLGSGALGQYFTPWHVSALMASMTSSPAFISETISKQGQYRMLEPACGSGGMVVASAMAFKNAGFDLSRQYYAEATDCDRVCVHMTYIACTIYGIPAKIIHGDTIRQEVWEEIPTPALIAARNAGYPLG